MWGKAFRNDAIMFQNPEACMTCTTLLNPSYLCLFVRQTQLDFLTSLSPSPIASLRIYFCL